ncbi:hypothetical protein JTB14_019183 [Gonioctena quinquepunctata]|nr:hypothetical protein JTB14_019183 [Gonioctena quinquepunctata]
MHLVIEIPEDVACTSVNETGSNSRLETGGTASTLSVLRVSATCAGQNLWSCDPCVTLAVVSVLLDNRYSVVFYRERKASVGK